MTDFAVNLLKIAAAENRAVLLHELLWAVDVKYHAILNLSELNEALSLSPRFHVKRNSNQIQLVPSPSAEIEQLSDEDIAKAMDVYRSTLF